MAFFHWMAGVCVGVLLVAAAPQIVHQATSDEGDGWSGACPGYESHAEAWDMSGTLPPTMD